ncbi:permease prefix domain 1-containing protein [Plantactinospora sp. CA-294935]|uniref:permease prefix domain 1-containing protein n=1 Tax=Plantactinospora sp. CA-294935 TaxID=3240012 RepID=UPI003D94542E
MTTTAPGTLTDRYLAAALGRLPGRQRADVERELRTSIADAIDERRESGADPAEAEIAVLTELGDPARLAAGYADRPPYLIGPGLFGDYTRLLRILLATVLPASVVGVALLRTVQGDTVAGVLGTAAGTAATVAVHIAFWTTLAFAVVERVAHRRHAAGWRAGRWTPAALPEPPSRRSRYAELISETAALVLFSSLVLLSPVLSTQRDAADRPVGILSPWLWETGVVYAFLAVAVLSLGFAYAKYYLRWNLALGITGSLVNLATPAMLIWLAGTDRVLSPAFVAAAGWSTGVSGWINTGLVVLAVLTILHTIGEAAGQARRR